jgi:hypothetical protein
MPWRWPQYGDRWWLSSEHVWLYGGWWNWLNGIAGLREHLLHDRLVGHLLLQEDRTICSGRT